MEPYLYSRERPFQSPVLSCHDAIKTIMMRDWRAAGISNIMYLLWLQMSTFIPQICFNDLQINLWSAQHYDTLGGLISHFYASFQGIKVTNWQINSPIVFYAQKHYCQIWDNWDTSFNWYYDLWSQSGGNKKLLKYLENVPKLFFLWTYRCSKA